jgi:hypothetical protein
LDAGGQMTGGIAHDFNNLQPSSSAILNAGNARRGDRQLH